MQFYQLCEGMRYGTDQIGTYASHDLHKASLDWQIPSRNKEIYEGVTDFASIFTPDRLDAAIKAIDTLAGLDKTKQEYKSPSTAFEMGSQLEKCGEHLITMCIKSKDKNRKTEVQDFLKILEEELAVRIVSGCSSTNVRGTEDGIDTLLRSEKNSEHTDAEISDESETYQELCSLPKDSWSKNTDKFTTYGKERCTSPHGKISRRSWNTPERTLVEDVFKEHIHINEIPSLMECKMAIKSSSTLESRTPTQLRAWVANQIKKKSTKTSKNRIYWTTEEKTIMENAISRNLSQEIKDQRKQAYQSTLRDYKTSIRRAKSESWGEFVEADLGTNPWGFTYRLASAKVKTSHLTSVIEDSVGQETTDMVETLQEIACQLMPDDDPATDNEENRRIRNGAREFTGSNIPVSPITEEDITEAAMRVKPGRAPGPDEVHGKIWVMMLPYIMESLLRIYNACLSLGIIPTVWKGGRLVTILKAPGRDPSDMGSLRPITLLSELGKMLERIIISKIQKAIPANRLISDNQFGFSKEKSTVDAIKHMLGHIDTHDKHHLVVFIDIKGAFNNMWWPFLLKFLHEVDIPTQLVALLNNYLKDREIKYQSNLEQIEKILTKRCPQGSA
ncbi:hypothetical protein JTB14_011640 [Gonioctena quinquepunctata]|nr:hypothetical protein JTB14_011640 [Gonioctena quinquepunctata]